MAGASVKMGVDVTQFKAGMREAQSSVKTLDAELKRNEAQLKATGDKEQYAADKASILQQKLNAQKQAAANAEKALKAMKDNGVKESSEEYQKLAQQLAAAQAGMYETTAALNQLTAGEQEAAKGANQLTESVNSIGKKISLDQVISGIGKITSSMENAAKKAVDLGETIWQNVMNSAQWADDSATMALMYGIDLDTFLRVQRLVQNGMDTSVEAILNSQSKLNKNVGKESKETMEALSELGISMRAWNKEYVNGVLTVTTRKDPADLFWEAGQAIMALGDAYEKESKAQAIFGRSWKELVPLFTEFKNRGEFEEALNGVQVNTEEEVNDLAALNDQVATLKGSFETLENKVTAGLAPALTKAAEVLDSLLSRIIEYLEKPEGQKALEDMGKAVEGLFEDLGKIEPDEVVAGFANVFNGIVGGLQWLEEHSGDVISAMEKIVKGWALLKITGGALQILQLIQGVQGLGGGAAVAAGRAGAAAGSSWGSAFAAAVLKVAPWLAGIYALVNPSETGNNDLVDANGNLTEEGLATWENQLRENKETGEKNRATELIEEAAEEFGDAARMYNDPRIAKALTEFANDRDTEKRDAALEALGYTKKPAFKEAAAKVDEGPGGQIENNRDIAIFKDRRTGEIIGISSTAVDSFMEQNRSFFTFGEKKVRAPYNMPEEMFQGIMEYADRQARGIWNYTHDANGEFTQGGEKLLDSSNYDFFYNLANGEVQIGDALKSLKDLNVSELAAVFEEIGGVKGRELMEQLPENVGSIAKGVETVGAELTGALSAAAEAIRNIQFPSILGLFGGFFPHANGLWNVPWDGYPAILHRGERVLTARENRQYTYNSNTYFGSVNLHNGLEVDALTESIDRLNSRKRSGYGA